MPHVPLHSKVVRLNRGKFHNGTIKVRPFELFNRDHLRAMNPHERSIIDGAIKHYQAPDPSQPSLHADDW